jgi:hypothetical protein
VPANQPASLVQTQPISSRHSAKASIASLKARHLAETANASMQSTMRAKI